MAVLTEQRFGILSDIMGVGEHKPTVKLPTTLMPESSGVFLRYGAIKAMPGATNALVDSDGALVQTTDGYPVIHFHRHISGEGVEYLFVYTKAHVYKWDETNKQYDEFFECGSDCTQWNTVSFDNKIISTNNVDKVQVWDESTPATVFAALDGSDGLDLDGGTTYLTAAAYVTGYENYLIFGDTTEGGTHYPNRIRWSTGGDITDYDATGSGDTGAKDFSAGYGVLKGFGLYTYQGADILVVFKEQTYFPMWLVEDASIWFIGNAQGHVGLLATHSIVNDSEGRLYWIGSDYAVHRFRGAALSGLMDKTLKGISVTYQSTIEAAYIGLYNQIWWSIPSSASSTGNDKIVALNLPDGSWHSYPFAYRAFGNWSQQSSHTIDGLDALASTIDGLDPVHPTIDYVEGMEGYPLDIVSDHSGYVYKAHAGEEDKGASVTRYFVLGTMLSTSLSLHLFKRVMKLKHILLGHSSGTLNFYAKSDNAADWESLGSISQISTQEVVDVDQVVDLRAKHVLIKGESTDLFDYLGLFFDFTFDGEY